MITVAPKTSKYVKNNKGNGRNIQIKTKPITQKYKEEKYFY